MRAAGSGGGGGRTRGRGRAGEALAGGGRGRRHPETGSGRLGNADRDERIIAALADDARMPAVKVAKKAGMSETMARNRMARMIREGSIRLTAERGDSMGAKAIVLVSAESASDISKISATLRDLARDGGRGAGGRGAGAKGAWRATTAKIYEITGQHDIAIIMSAAGIHQINETIDAVRRVPGVTDTNTVIILKTVA